MMVTVGPRALTGHLSLESGLGDAVLDQVVGNLQVTGYLVAHLRKFLFQKGGALELLLTGFLELPDLLGDPRQLWLASSIAAVIFLESAQRGCTTKTDRMNRMRVRTTGLDLGIAPPSGLGPPQVTAATRPKTNRADRAWVLRAMMGWSSWFFFRPGQSVPWIAA